MDIACPACGCHGNIPETFLGKPIRCKRCGSRFRAAPTAAVERRTGAPPKPKISSQAEEMSIPDDIGLAPLKPQKVDLKSAIAAASYERTRIGWGIKGAKEQQDGLEREWSAEGGWESLGPCGGKSAQVVIWEVFGFELQKIHDNPHSLLAFALVLYEDMDTWENKKNHDYREWRDAAQGALNRFLMSLKEKTEKGEPRPPERIAPLLEYLAENNHFTSLAKTLMQKMETAN